MIELFTWPTPNGQKVHIALEELGLPYTVTAVNIGEGDQFKPEFLAINPNHRIPAIIDTDGPGGAPLPLFESGAILIYLAEKAGGLVPADPAARYTCLQWLMFQMGGVGPMFGQANHFINAAPEKIPYAIERYGKEVARLVRAGKAPASGGLSGWRRVFDRRYRHVSLDPLGGGWRPRVAGRSAVGAALARCDRCPAGGCAWPGHTGGPSPAGPDQRPGSRHTVWRHAAHGALNGAGRAAPLSRAGC